MTSDPLICILKITSPVGCGRLVLYSSSEMASNPNENFDSVCTPVMDGFRAIIKLRANSIINKRRDSQGLKILVFGDEVYLQYGQLTKSKFDRKFDIKHRLMKPAGQHIKDDT
uniref:Uncharacterized protein n=1 Tax=Romanomermis culicivorax TaxID=13658 RepID=A0A915HYC2_ROMCU